MRRLAVLSVLMLARVVVSFPQTTQGLISGRTLDAQTGLPVSGTVITSVNSAANIASAARTDSSGSYLLPLLPPGRYRIRVTAAGYQAQDVEISALSVAEHLKLNFRLRPLNDVWEAGQYRSLLLPDSESVVTFFGPDVDAGRFGTFAAAKGRSGALETSVSAVIDPAQVQELPLAGRDVYTMLVTQPGVASDASTARGLGLSIHGQRPTSSNFLLDGLENNNYLITGPLMTVAPEAVQEYRVSTSSYSAEYGRTGGFLANAVTRGGGARWHGIGYFNGRNEALNANGFQENRSAQRRTPSKEDQWGFQAGGPMAWKWLRSSTSFDQLRRSQRDPSVSVLLPGANLLEFTTPGSAARQMLSRFPSRAPSSARALAEPVSLSAPNSVDRSLFLQRIDFQPRQGMHRMMGRIAVARLGRPDFIWSPYPDFTSALHQHSDSYLWSAIDSWRPNLSSEVRVGWSRDNLQWERPHPEIPTLTSLDGVILPGSPAFYSYRNRSQGLEATASLLWARSRHIFKGGGGFLGRWLDGYLTAGRDGQYVFSDVLAFASDAPLLLSAPLNRAPGALRLPEFDRGYRYDQFFLFAQDTFQLGPRFTLNYGLRYESFGSPRNTGAVKDAQIRFGGGDGVPGGIASARLLFPAVGSEPLYPADRNDWAGRMGFSFQPPRLTQTLLRGAVGAYYDRPFDNLWQNLRNNNYGLVDFDLSRQPGFNFLTPVSQVVSRFSNSARSTDFPSLSAFQPDLRSPYVISYFLGLQQKAGDSWTLECDGLGMLGRKLISTDLVNRSFSLPLDPVSNPAGRFNPALPTISYRANQGASNYHAMSLKARFRSRLAQGQVAYTWSHAIDNQSDPLTGDFFDLKFTGTSAAAARAIATFTRQFDSRADRGNADFDQRHNLVFFSVWELPRLLQARKAGWLLRDWKFSQLAAVRSGLPFTVNVASVFVPGQPLLYNNRADLVNRDVFLNSDTPGGRRVLNPAAFRAPTGGRIGSLGRNSLSGPGLFNIDASLSRSFPVSWLGDSGKLSLRADAFNALNHANLNNPDSFLTSSNFGIALFGRIGVSSSFPAIAPLKETARQFQLIVRLEF